MQSSILFPGIWVATGGLVVLGLAYFALVRAAERLVLLPGVGFVFTIIFCTVPMAIDLAVTGGAVVLVVRGAFHPDFGSPNDVRLIAAVAGLAILNLKTNSTWDELLEHRKAITGSTKVPISPLANKIQAYSGRLFDMIGALAPAVGGLVLTGYLLYMFFFL